MFNNENVKSILKTIGYYYSDGKEHRRCPVCGINPNRLNQEIDKAREEGKLEYILSLGWQDTDNEYVKEVLEDAERIAEKLSKLKE